MSFSSIRTRGLLGLVAPAVMVETHISNGLPGFQIVGLAETAVKESKDRVRSALMNSQLEFPTRRITVNLAPADFPKTGSGFDLAIAVGVLAASGQLPKAALEPFEWIGELALNGEIRPVPAIIPQVLAAQKDNKTLIIPHGNAEEAARTGYANVYSVKHLHDIIAFVHEQKPLTPLPELVPEPESEEEQDWSDVKGQHHAKEALIFAAMGGHSVLMYGPPGSGKSMLSSRFSDLLPLLSKEDALEVAAIHSLRGSLSKRQAWQKPPYRAPHHTASSAALVGGGNPPKPGEISLAHRGVLFLDELPEFSRSVLETLREPIETGEICLSRASRQTTYPASFQLISAMNPCPCGHFGNPRAECICSPERISRYLGKLSGPLLDRIDIQVNLKALTEEELITPIEKNLPKQTPVLRSEVSRVRAVQLQRQGCLNADLSPKQTELVCALGEPERQFLEMALQKLRLSARAYHRLLRLARTISDRQGEERISMQAMQFALSFRQCLPGSS